MRCASCGTVSHGAGRCAACGSVIPLPGEDRALERPVSVTVFVDRRNRTPGSPGFAPAPPPALTRELPLDRREEPRPPRPAPVDPVRPVAAAARHLLRHVAAVAPTASPWGGNAPTGGGGPGPGAGSRPSGGTAAAGPEDGSSARWALGEEDDFEVTLELDEAREAALPEEVADELLLPPAPPAWRRLLSWAIDGALLGAVPLVALAAATRGATGPDGNPVPFSALLLESGAVQGAALVLAAVTAFVYLTLSAAVGGRTPGAALAGLGLVSCESGGPPGLGRAALRAALAVAGVFAFFAGPLSALLDGRGRALHDKLVGTVVVADR